MSHLTVSDVMTADVVSVQEDTAYKEIAQRLADRNISAVPVVDEENRVIGVVSEADLMHKVEFSGSDEGVRLFQRHRAARHKAVADSARALMSSPVVTVAPDAPLAKAARMMDAGNVKRLPVVDADGRLLGVVSRRDLLRAYVRPDDVIRREVVSDVLGRVLWLNAAAFDVDVTEGVVTIAGQVETKSLAGITARLIRAVDGVVSVVDRLTFATDDTEMISQGRRAVGW